MGFKEYLIADRHYHHEPGVPRGAPGSDFWASGSQISVRDGPLAVGADLRHYARYERVSRAIDPAVARRAATRRRAGSRFRTAVPGSRLGGDHRGYHAHSRGQPEVRLGFLVVRSADSRARLVDGRRAPRHDRVMTQAPESPIQSQPAQEASHPRLYQVAAWVVIVAGIVFVVAVVFFAGAWAGGGGHHFPHHHHGVFGPDGPGGPDGPPPWPGPWGQGPGPGGPGWPGPWGPGMGPGGPGGHGGHGDRGGPEEPPPPPPSP